jgi:hypothetical protein
VEGPIPITICCYEVVISWILLIECYFMKLSLSAQAASWDAVYGPIQLAIALFRYKLCFNISYSSEASRLIITSALTTRLTTSLCKQWMRRMNSQVILNLSTQLCPPHSSTKSWPVSRMHWFGWKFGVPVPKIGVFVCFTPQYYNFVSTWPHKTLPYIKPHHLSHRACKSIKPSGL